MLTVLSFSATAEVRLPGWMTDNMVLQQQSALHLKATAKPKAKVKVTASWNREVLETRADAEGRFALDLAIPEAGGPYTLTFNDGRKTVLDNVMVGEVWFCSGQSNMEMPVKGWGRVKDFEQEVANANHPLIRLFQVKEVTALTPQTEVPYGHTNGWAVCSPEMVEEFSATAYFFARTLSERLGIAVGVVNSSWGGTPAETWTSHEALKHVTGFEDMLKRIEEIGPERVQTVYEESMADWNRQFLTKDQGLRDADIHSPKWNAETDGWQTMSLPALWEDQGLPGFDGVAWFRRVVDIPADLAGKDLMLNLGMIDDEDKTYWNGEMVAEGSGFNQQRHYTVPGRLVKAGQNVILVRVTDTGGEGGIYGKPEDMTLDGKISMAGLWQYRVGVSLKELPQRPMSPTSSWWPSACYNAMVAPFLGMPIRGTIWYQGCANVGRAEQYESLFQTLIHDWKQRFGEHPFYFVQLANYLSRRDVQPESEWAALREAQRSALQIGGTGMMVNITLGDAGDIHPKNKQEVGRRLARLALNRTYGQPEPGCAPEFQQMSIVGDKAFLVFSLPQGAEGLATNPDIKGFTIAGPDQKWYKAQARTLTDHSVVVSAPEVAVPIAVRYGWADNPECTLATPEGFDVSPFRTDNWK
ncbi:MAG: 9-O-acetylesterase [Bacteroidaceae bacterium]|nr:9-O-acetylesterase [Bacteroidaceae bacterium]